MMPQPDTTPRNPEEARVKSELDGQSRRKKEKEIVTACIMAIVGCAGFALLYFAAFDENPIKRRISRTCDDLAVIDTGIRKFTTNAGRPPIESEGLAALVTRPTTLEPSRGWVQVMRGIPMDPWGHAYIYHATVNGTRATVKVSSPSADGIPGDEDDIETDPVYYDIEPSPTP